MRSITEGCSTKNPPLIQLPSPSGFSESDRLNHSAKLQSTIATLRAGCSERRLFAMLLMESDECSDIDITHAIAIGKTKRLFIFHILANALQTPARHCVLARIHQGDRPGLCIVLVHPLTIAFHAEGDIGLVQEVIRKILFDHVALVATTNHEIIHAMRRIDLHDVPKNRLAANLNHRLGF